MKLSHSLAIAPLLILNACTIYVEDPNYTPEPHIPFWAREDFKASHTTPQISPSVSGNKFYKIDLGVRKTESDDIKVSLYLLECDDPKSKDHCTKSPLNESIGLSYAVKDGYTGELLENKSVTTSEPQYIIKTKRNYPECLSVTISNSKNLSIQSQNITFNESRVVGC